MDTKELIFEIYKDQVIWGKKFKGEIKKKYHLETKEISDIYTRIHNYQIKTYGSRLGSDFSLPNHEEKERIRNTARTRKYQKKNKYWENQEHYRRFG